MPHKIGAILGSFHKRRWHAVSNEDHAEAFVRFEGGPTAHLQPGPLSAIGKPCWRILGTLGGIEKMTGEHKEPIKVVSLRVGFRQEMAAACLASDGDELYRNRAGHLILGEPLAVAPESARKVMAVLSLAEQSSKQGGVWLALPVEQEGRGYPVLGTVEVSLWR